MDTHLHRAHRALPVILGAVTLAGVALLLAWDVRPALFPGSAHGVLGAFPLAMVALAYLVYESVRRPPLREWIKAVLLAVAFLFWAANQCWPNPQQATLFNDIAIALFVLDMFLIILGWPAPSPDASFGETGSGPACRSLPRDSGG